MNTIRALKNLQRYKTIILYGIIRETKDSTEGKYVRWDQIRPIIDMLSEDIDEPTGDPVKVRDCVDCGKQYIKKRGIVLCDNCQDKLDKIYSRNTVQVKATEDT